MNEYDKYDVDCQLNEKTQKYCNIQIRYVCVF